jgi:hypothetical protein
MTHLFGASAEARDDLALHLVRVRLRGTGLFANDLWSFSHWGGFRFGHVMFGPWR